MGILNTLSSFFKKRGEDLQTAFNPKRIINYDGMKQMGDYAKEVMKEDESKEKYSSFQDMVQKNNHTEESLAALYKKSAIITFIFIGASAICFMLGAYYLGNLVANFSFRTAMMITYQMATGTLFLVLSMKYGIIAKQIEKRTLLSGKDYFKLKLDMIPSGINLKYRQ